MIDLTKVNSHLAQEAMKSYATKLLDQWTDWEKRDGEDQFTSNSDFVYHGRSWSYAFHCAKSMTWSMQQDIDYIAENWLEPGGYHYHKGYKALLIIPVDHGIGSYWVVFGTPETKEDP